MVMAATGETIVANADYDMLIIDDAGPDLHHQMTLCLQVCMWRGHVCAGGACNAGLLEPAAHEIQAAGHPGDHQPDVADLENVSADSC